MRDDRIIVPLSVGNLDDGHEVIRRVSEVVGYIAIKPDLVMAEGMSVIHDWFDQNIDGGVSRLMLDGRFCDGSKTMARIAKLVSRFKIRVFTIHASSGMKAMRAAVENKGDSIVLAVTVSSSLDKDSAHLIFGAPVEVKTLQLARDAVVAGVDGVICSGRGLETLGNPEHCEEFSNIFKVACGVRPDWDRRVAPDEQMRNINPRRAFDLGANYAMIYKTISDPPEGLTTEGVVRRISEEIGGIKK